MSKYISLLILFFTLFLASCATETEPAVTQMVTQEADQVEEQSPTRSVQNTPEVDSINTTGDLMACNVVGLLPPLDPTQAAIFPEPGESDWIAGPDDAQVTIIEYSDFQ